MGKHCLDIKVFKDCMKEIEILFDRQLSEEQLILYYKHLKNEFENDRFLNTCKEVIRKERFFPTISAFYTNKHETNFEKAM